MLYCPSAFCGLCHQTQTAFHQGTFSHDFLLLTVVWWEWWDDWRRRGWSVSLLITETEVWKPLTVLLPRPVLSYSVQYSDLILILLSPLFFLFYAQADFPRHSLWISTYLRGYAVELLVESLR
jgi:hypothetical protein